MKNYIVAVAVFVFLATSPARAEDYIAITGGTVIDVSAWGTSEGDIEDAVVLVSGPAIVAVGKRGEVDIPPGAQIIDATGKYLVPGLIDSFAVLNNQQYANAYLACGVTSIVGVDGGRRGVMFHDADPGPAIYMLEGIGEEPISTDDLVAGIKQLAESGHRVVLLMYSLDPEQLSTAIQTAHSLGMSTIGELATTSYAEAITLGIDAFVHTTRYSLDTAPREMAEAIARYPFSDDLDSPKWQYYFYLTSLDPQGETVRNHARVLAGGVPLIPTLSLLYLDLPDHKNLWHDPVAQLINPDDINNPADRETGSHSYDAAHMEAYARMAQAELGLEKQYYGAGAHYLAGSGTDVWGTMPGVSMHTELALLKKIGLTNRQLLAACTSNTARTLKLGNIGEIAAGNQADILILNSNPLEDPERLRDIGTLLLDGIAIDLATLLN